jgi:2-polyprenyl-3-methyl-5-hydroxy-6-metoxy-1,4-benzoquinol methylase
VNGTTLTTAAVRAYFDEEARRGRRLLPDPATASGLGTYVKYCRATSLIAEPSVRAALDIGCSVGSIESLFHQQYPTRAASVHIEGVDISDEAVRQASALALPNCTFRTYAGTDLPYRSDTFDLVIAIEVIEHVVDKPRFLAEAWRVLRPGGRFLLTTPNPQCWALRAEQLLECTGRWCLARPAPDKDAYITLIQLSRLLESAGFCRWGSGSWHFWPRLYVSLFGWGVLPPLPPRLLALYQRLCVRALRSSTLDGFAGCRIAWSTSALWQKPRQARD